MSDSRKLSIRHEQFRSFLNCPICEEFPISPAFWGDDGKRYPQKTKLEDMSVQTLAECPKCLQKWSVFDDVQQSELKIVETAISEEVWDSQQEIVDNQSSATLQSRYIFSKEWSKSYILDYEELQNTGLTITFPIFKLNMQKMLKEKYSISETLKLTHTKEISLEVPAWKKVHLFIRWKRRWQNGYIEIHDSQLGIKKAHYKIELEPIADKEVREEEIKKRKFILGQF